MTSFGWKKKLSGNIKRPATKAFEENEQVGEEVVDPDFDWIAQAKRQKFEALEDNKALFARLKQEGVTLAEDGKFWQAIDRWDNALAINAEDATVFEMKAQALINLHEWIVAIKSVEKSVQLRPNWWVAHQTLGRAQMGIGEVRLALRSFKIATHLNPDDKELRTDDLGWAFSLLREKQAKESSEIVADKSDSLSRNSLCVKLRN